MFEADETNFFVELNDGRILAMKGDKKVKYSDVLGANVGNK